MMFRRSVTKGRSWEAIRTLVDGKTGSAGGKKIWHDCGLSCAVWDPTPVTLQATGEVILFFGRSLCHNMSASSCDGQRQDIWQMRSTNQGIDWTTPRNVTDECGCSYRDASGARRLGTMAGGHGVELSNGRQVVPVYACGPEDLGSSTMAEPATSRARAAAGGSGSGGGQGTCFSTDQGVSFQLGKPFSLPCAPTEGEVAELFEKTAAGDPKLIFDVRQGCPGAKCRTTVLSTDQGVTWMNDSAVCHGEMPDPGSKGSILRWQHGGKRGIVASNSASTTARVNETLYLSTDDAKTFGRHVHLSSGGGYSSLQQMANGHVANIYEAGPDMPHCHLRVAVVDPAALSPAPAP